MDQSEGLKFCPFGLYLLVLTKAEISPEEHLRCLLIDELKNHSKPTPCLKETEF